jgi:polyribonucleotide nucleotidyltransferase
MDFKVAGTATGITALQMDIKVEGITIDIMRKALLQAKAGRLHILGEMQKAQAEPNRGLPVSLPKVRTLRIPVKRIGDVIGPGGRTIKSLIERCGGEGNMSINIEDDGVVSFSCSDEEMIARAFDLVQAMVVSVDVGARFEGTVSKVLPFGAYVSIENGKEGWLHISELEWKRTTNVEDVLAVGDKCTVQVIEVGRNGQFRLSRKACLPKPAPSSGPSRTAVSGEEPTVVPGPRS